MSAKSTAKQIKAHAIAKGLWAMYKTAMSGTIYLIVKRDEHADSWLKIRIGRHRKEDSKYRDKFKSDDVNVDIYRIDNSWDATPALKAIDQHFDGQFDRTLDKTP